MAANTPIYLINLDRDAERLAYMKTQLDKLSLSFERFPAIYGVALPDWLRPFFLDKDRKIASDLRAGEVGCYASHLMLMKRVMDSGESAIILEDDLSLSQNFPEVMRRCLPSLPAGLDMLKLAGRDKRTKFQLKALPTGHRLVKYARVPLGTGAYFITPAGAKKFLSWKTLRSAPIDEDLRRPWDCRMSIYGLDPAPTMQNVGASSITTIGERPRGRKYYPGHPVQEAAIRAAYEIGWLGTWGWVYSRFIR